MTTVVKHSVVLTAPITIAVTAEPVGIPGAMQGLRVTPSRMIFTDNNWDVPQTVTVAFDADAGRGTSANNIFGVKYTIEGTGISATAEMSIHDEKDTSKQHSWRDASIGTTTINGYGTIELAGLVEMTDYPLPGAQDGGAITYTVHPPLPNGLSIKETGDPSNPHALTGTPTSSNITTTHQWRANSPGFEQILVIFNIKVTSSLPSFGGNEPTERPVFVIGSAKTYVYPYKATGGVGGLTYSLERHDPRDSDNDQTPAAPPPGLTVDTVPDGEANAGYPRIHGTATGFTTWQAMGQKGYSGGRTAQFQQNSYYLVATDGVGEKARMPVYVSVLEDLKPDLPAMGRFANALQTTTIPTFEANTNVPFSAQLPTATGGNGKLTYSLNREDSLSAIGVTFNSETSVLSGTPVRGWGDPGPDPKRPVYTLPGLVTLTVTDEDGDTDITTVFVRIHKNPLRVSGNVNTDPDDRNTWLTLHGAHREAFPHAGQKLVQIVPQTGGGKVTYRIEGLESYDGHGNAFIPDGLPEGLTLNAETGKITGTITGYRHQTMYYVATASDATYGDSFQVHYRLEIKPKVSWKSSDNAVTDVNLRVDHNYSLELPMLWRDGATAPFTSGYKIVHGEVPSWLSIGVSDGKLRFNASPTAQYDRTTFTVGHINHTETIKFHVAVRPAE